MNLQYNCLSFSPPFKDHCRGDMLPKLSLSYNTFLTTLLPQLAVLLAKADAWQYDMFALEAATSGHALSVLGFALIKRTEAFQRFRLDEGRLTR